MFESIALCEALERHSSLLDGETRAKWENKLARMANWLYHELTEDAPTNINYTATNAAALALTVSISITKRTLRRQSIWPHMRSNILRPTAYSMARASPAM